jgi:hypothetical protein
MIIYSGTFEANDRGSSAVEVAIGCLAILGAEEAATVGNKIVMQLELERLALAKENNSKEMLATENIILKNKFIAYVSDLEQYLFTQTTPSLAWKPNSQAAQNDKVSKAIQESREVMQV